MRVFVAVDVGDAVRGEVTRVVTTLTGKLEAVKTPPKVVWVKPAALHVTIRFIGEVEPPEVERLQELLMPPIDVAPFELEWRGIGTFPNNKHPRALWLGVRKGADAVLALQQRLAARLHEVGVAAEDRAFTPHLTLARWRGRGGRSSERPRDLDVPRTSVATAEVAAVTLFQSRLASQGPAYTVLAESPLVGPNLPQH